MAHRIERVNQLIRQELSELLHRQLKDPRLGSLLSVTEVDTTADLKYAKIFVSCITTEEGKQEILSVLTAASGFIRNEMTRHLSLRRIPELSFHWDDSIERGARILELIDRVSTSNTSD
ncbi:30S ribosome-binding factor RbfA [Chloroflexota bacterium]